MISFPSVCGLLVIACGAVSISAPTGLHSLEGEELEVAAASLASSHCLTINTVIDQLVSYHQEGVDEVVEWKTMEWHYHAGHESYSEVSMNACPRTSPKIRKAPKELPAAILETFEWDDEQDIEQYLSRLEQGCSKNASSPEFKKDCLEFVRQLIYEPRCTTRFDSRVQCQRGKPPLSPPHIDSADRVRHLLDNHFSDNTLNVLIVGGGPVGLFLANALAMFNELSQPNHLHYPTIRVVLIENRAQAEGAKLPYTRNWDTEMYLSAFDGAVDSRLVDIFRHISTGEMFSLPLNGIETLLLMSSRDKGVKFVYGNLTDYTDLLSVQPNLIAFDVTGHHLNCLVRGDDCPRPDPVPGLVQTVVEANEVDYTVDPSFRNADLKTAEAYAYYKEYNHLVEAKQKGGILYPVAEDGTPFTSWWVHVNFFGYPHKKELTTNEEEEMVEVSEKTDLCDACVEDPQIKETMMCQKACHLSYVFGNRHTLREDIPDHLLEFGEKLWFSLALGTINLSGKQATMLQDLILQSDYANNTVGMPLDLVPWDELSKHPVFQEGHFLTELASIRKHGSNPFISVFQNKPYVYLDGEIEGDLFGEMTPILRMGDSLVVGDANHGTGISNHYEFVWGMLCRMQGLKLGYDYACEEP